ncbi:hypothetical protein TPHA_0G01190 [Tetrapisispora phaffii CBS 4417]|uniref:Uncharacterized protein n=1 Tax=Tetrapisispora phaffii (strain ATCC 24235 / CBS 4417 / NBRC 1672 / NRRL Y-8282 / UCD 70-5) TaxID=1071381 RepID=G8BVM8_TETPH|nr:hypothetical protein TPHA_0G01190 [Tetrapisispora phaffii CBS 4417]CCE63956.1 hypothetical protein TPHA_0G01190 [Tetrapisispora phaffii CBS 4417]
MEKELVATTEVVTTDIKNAEGICSNKILEINGDLKAEINSESVDVEIDEQDVSSDDIHDSSEELEDENPEIVKDEKYWEERRHKFILDVDPKIAKLRDKNDTYLRFKHLLNVTDLFRHFLGIRAKQDKNIQKLLKRIDEENSKKLNHSAKSGRAKSKGSRHGRKSEKEEDAELLVEEEDDDVDDKLTLDSNQYVSKSPSYIKSGTLRDYQIQGLNWLISLYENKLSGILADEMGLGKTLQTISFLGYLRYHKQVDGPFLVIVPKSTLDNWRREFKKWTPDVNAVILHGDKEKRHDILQNRVLQAKFDVLITSYEMIIKEKNVLKKVAWEYIVIDEAHRIKNEQSSLSQIIRLFYSRNRLLITGTPLQNNLHELWALLNFLLSDVFSDSELFDEWFEQNNSEEDQEVVVQQLHTVLNPFLLRRIKADVEKSLLPKIEVNLYVGMAQMQRKWYKSLLEKDIDAVNGAVTKREGKTRLLNIVMQLRKCCNHPYLFEGAEPGPPYTTDEHLVFNSGKMIILDKLLKRLKEKGSRVLIFSQMSRLLDILEDYCYLRDYEYCRIDGSTSHEERIEAIDEYNKPDSDKFIFLLTTRAGGLGINLVTADTVVLFDSDWNPQADLQAMDRAHRIGQKKQVYVYRFVTENAIEEKVIERAAQKLRLDQLVIQQGTGKKTASIGNNKDDLIEMVQYGAKDVFEKEEGVMTEDIDIDEILQKGEKKTKELNAKYESLGLDDLQKYNGLEGQSAYEWNGQDFQKKQSEEKFVWINPSRRERRREQQTYSVDDYYKDIIGGGSKSKDKISKSQKPPKAPKNINLQDFQFYPKELVPLLEKEQLAYKKKVNYRVTKYDVSEMSFNEDDLSDNDSETPADENLKKKIKALQDAINNSEEFTKEDELEKQRLISKAFLNWNKRDLFAFVNACSKYGKDNIDMIQKSFDSKTPEEVKAYHKVFWERYSELNGYEKYIATIETGMRKIEKLRIQELLVRKKIQQYSFPLREMRIQYPPNNARKVYSTLEDKFILMMIDKYGLFDDKFYEKLKQEILTSKHFTFDWYIKSRSTNDLSKRVTTLLSLVQREFEAPATLKKKRTKPLSREETPVSYTATPVPLPFNTVSGGTFKKFKHNG